MTSVSSLGNQFTIRIYTRREETPMLKLCLISCIATLAAAATALAQQPAKPPAAQTHLAAAQIQSEHTPASPISKYPRVNILHQDFASGCPNGADPTGQKDSTCAIQAAIDYADSHTVGGQLSALYFPVGNYLISSSVRLPCNLQVLTDGPTASALTLAPNSRSNAVTVVPPRFPFSDSYLCAGGIDGLNIQGSGHTDTGTLLEIINGTGYRLNDVKLYNSGGRGLSLQGSAERIESHNLQIDAVRWPITMSVNANEDHFFKTNIEAPGQSGDNYCFNINCVDGKFPGPNQGPGGSPTPIRPDPHGAVWMSGVDVAFYGGSIKALEYQHAFHVAIAQSSTIANFYLEDFPDRDHPDINSAVEVGGLLPMTKLTAPLDGTCTSNCSVSVASTDWFPDYTNDPADIEKYLAGACNEYEWIMPADFEWGNNAPSASVSGVARDQYETVCVNGMSGDGKMHIVQRHASYSSLRSTAPPNISWPPGSIVHMVTTVITYGSGLTLLSNHISGMSPGGPGYRLDCNDADSRTCGNIIVGPIPDGYLLNPRGSKANSPLAGLSGAVTLIDNSFFTGGPESMGEGFIKVHNLGQLTVLSHPASIASRGETDEALKGQETSSGVLPQIQAVQYPTGAHAEVDVSRPDTGGFLNSFNGYFEQSVTGFDPNLGGNPGIQAANGHQFLNSSCWYDGGSTQAPHAGNRFCMKGGTQFALANSGWEYDIWNGRQWVDAFSISGSAQGVASLNVTGNTKTATLELGSSNVQLKSVSGNSPTLATVTGALTPGHILVADSGGNIRDGGAPARAALEDTRASGFGGGSGFNGPDADSQSSLTALTTPVIVCSFAKDGFTSSIPATTLCAIPRTGTYEITLNTHTSNTGTAGQLLGANVYVAPVAGSSSQACSVTAPVNLANFAPQQFAGPCTLRIDAGQIVSFDTAAKGISGGAAYGLAILIKQVQ
jgi:hypothetical protein